MTDPYTDLNEQIRYSDHFLATAPAYAGLHGVVNDLIKENTAIRDECANMVATSQNTRADVGISRADRRTLDEEVKSDLGTLFFLLKTVWSTDSPEFRRYYPTGTQKDIGRNVTDRKAALTRCLEAMATLSDFPDAGTWKQKLEDLKKRYNAQVDDVSSRDGVKRTTTQELKDVRARWKRTYLYTKRIMFGLLIRAGREAEYHSLFLDLQTSPRSSSGTDPSDSEVEPAETPLGE